MQLGPRSQRNARGRQCPIHQSNVSTPDQEYRVLVADADISQIRSKTKPQRHLPDLPNVVGSQARQTQLEQLGLDNK